MVKTQVATNRRGLLVHQSRAGPGRDHDYKIFKESLLPKIIPKESKLYGDSGLQGVNKDFPYLKTAIPFKRNRWRKELTRSQKIYNTKQRRIRVKVEHTFSQLKKYQVLAQPYRHALEGYEETFGFVANVVNFRMLQRLAPL